MTNHFFYALTARDGKAIRCAILLTLFFVASCRADQVPLPDLRDLDLSSWSCQNEGQPRNPAGASRNRMKNRAFVAITDKNIPQWDYAQFVEHAKAFDAELGNPTHRSNMTAEAQAKLAGMETQMVSVTGWMVLTYPGPPESCNCSSSDFHDWHIELLPKPLDHSPRIGDPAAIISEVTPRTEAALKQAGVRLLKLAAYMNQGKRPNIVAVPTGTQPHKVRITGYLLWDDEHRKPGDDTGTTIERGGNGDYHHPWRATAWEIHPILKIEDLGTKE
jgi:hypothetical protein